MDASVTANARAAVGRLAPHQQLGAAIQEPLDKPEQEADPDGLRLASRVGPGGGGRRRLSVTHRSPPGRPVRVGWCGGWRRRRAGPRGGHALTGTAQVGVGVLGPADRQLAQSAPLSDSSCMRVTRVITGSSPSSLASSPTGTLSR
jgi:hypothetical protein